MATKEDIKALKTALGIRKETQCSFSENEQYAQLLKEGKPLPEGVVKIPDSSDEYPDFCVIIESKLSEDELAEYIQLRQLKNIITIKKCLVFFTTMSIISIIGGIIGIIAAFA